MPAAPSSLIPTLAHRLETASPLQPGRCPDLLAALAALPDPRARRGRRHRLVSVLAVAVAAVLAGHHSLAAIAEWAQDAPQAVLAALGVRRHPLTGAYQPPGEATVRRLLTRLDADALDRVLGGWLADQQPPPARSPSAPGRPVRAVAIDGKTLRGSAGQGGKPMHLLATMEHATSAVWAQTEVDTKTNEITRFQPLLEGLDLTGVVVTADAMQTQREHAAWPVEHQHAAYLLLVKDNQPPCAASSSACPGPTSPPPTQPATARTAAQRSER